jgi:hypothetical protein
LSGVGLKSGGVLKLEKVELIMASEAGWILRFSIDRSPPYIPGKYIITFAIDYGRRVLDNQK